MTLDIQTVMDLAPELLKFIIPGYIFLCIFKKFACVDIESVPQWIWSVVISYGTIAIAETAIAQFGRYFMFWELVFWCILIDVLSAVVLSALWNTDWFRNLVKTKIGATLYDGALQNAIDWNEASYVCVYLKSTDSYFAGNIVMIDNNTDGYITISAPVHYDANHSVIASNEQSVDVIMAIPIDDVKRIKIIN